MKKSVAGCLWLVASCLSPLLATNDQRLATAFSEELKVGAQVDKTEVPTGEPITYSIIIAGPVKAAPKIQITAFEGFEVLSTGQSQQIQMQGSEIRSALVLTYTLAPTTPGTQLLGPVKIQYQGHEYQTQPIEIKVVPGAAQKELPPRSRPKRPQPPRLEGGVIL